MDRERDERKCKKRNMMGRKHEIRALFNAEVNVRAAKRPQTFSSSEEEAPLVLPPSKRAKEDEVM